MRAARERPGARVVLRYLLLQLPGWVLVALLLLALAARTQVPDWALWAAGVLWLLKDVALFPMVWRAYAGTGGWPFSPVGQCGVAVGDLAPRGLVRVRGEIWQAVAASDNPIRTGSAVQVVGREGLTLRVQVRARR
jgi:membrane protein implicated in regulation of membrane protease activity